MGFWKNTMLPIAEQGVASATGVPVGVMNKETDVVFKPKRKQEPNNAIAPRWSGDDPTQGGYSIPMFRNGGHLAPGEAGIVGDGTDDPRAEEVVNVNPDGSGVSIAPIMPPNSDVRAQTNDIDSKLPNVVDSVFAGIAPRMDDGPKINDDPSLYASMGSQNSPTPPPAQPMPQPPPGAVDPDAAKIAANMGGPAANSLSPGQAALASSIDSMGGIAPALPKVEDDPNLDRRQQRLMTSGATHDSAWKRIGLSALRGLAVGGPGGAIGGALVGGIGKDLYQNRKTKDELGETNKLISQRNANTKAGYEAQNAGATYQHQLIQNQLGIDEIGYNKLIHDPQWMIAQQTKRISPEQAQYLSQLVGKPVTQASWQTFVEKTDPATGASEIRPEFDPRYSVNPTISPDATVPPKGVTVGGIPLTLKQPEVGTLITSENNNNANRTQQTQIHNATATDEATRFNAQEQTRVAQSQFQNRVKALEQMGTNIGNAGEVKGFADKGGQYIQQMNDLQTSLDKAQPESPEREKLLGEYNRVQSEFADNIAKFNAALGKTQGGLQVLTQLQQMDSQIPAAKTYTPTNVTPVQTNTVKPAAPGGKVLTRDAVKAAAKQHGVSYSQALKQAQSQGYSIQ